MEPEPAPERRRFHFPIPELLLEHVRRQCTLLNIQPTVYIRRALDVCLHGEEPLADANPTFLNDLLLSMDAVDSVKPDNAFGMMCEDEVQVHLQQLADLDSKRASGVEPWHVGYTDAPILLTEQQRFSLSLVALRDGYQDERAVLIASVTRLTWMYDYALGSPDS